MKLVHLADLHLGFRQFDRLDPNGVNQREVDVARTASRAMELVIAQRPDIIVIGGDVFHQSHPSNPAIVHAFMMFSKLRAALPDCVVIVVAGNHDAPRTADAGCILALFRQLHFYVVERAALNLQFPELGLFVLAVPDVVGLERPTLVPCVTAEQFNYRVLLMHGEIAGILRVKTPHDIDPMDLHADQWSYIALGHYHVYREVAPRAYYSGSLDYVSSDPWGEMREQRDRGINGKGFIVHDLATGEHEFVSVPVSRQFIDLEAIDCSALSARDIDGAIRDAVDRLPRGIDGAVVRVVLTNCSRALARELDSAAISEYRSRALSFKIDVRKPEETSVALSIGAPSERRTARDVTRDYFTAREVPAEITRDELVATALAHLTVADDRASSAPQLVEV